MLRGVKYIESNGKWICKDSLMNNQLVFDEKIEVKFTKENENFQPPLEFVQAADLILSGKDY